MGNKLMEFPKDTINDEMVELMDHYLSQADYNLEGAKKTSGDVAGLCSWTEAMSFFFSINKEVLPLKANLVVQEAKLEKANAELAVAQAQLAEVRKTFDEAVGHKQALIDDAESCKKKMSN